MAPGRLGFWRVGWDVAKRLKELSWNCHGWCSSLRDWLLPKTLAYNYTETIRLLVRNESQRGGGVEKKSRVDGVHFHSFQPEMSLDKINSSHLREKRVQRKKVSSKQREIYQKINDYCLIIRPVTLYFPHTLRNVACYSRTRTSLPQAETLMTPAL